MIYNDRVLANEDGTEAIENGKPATALLGIKRALVSDGKQLTPDQKAKRFDLFSKLSMAGHSGLSVELTIDEVALAKDAIDVYPTLVYGQLLAFLNQK